MPCFWTDYEVATEDCEEGGGGPNTVAVVVNWGPNYERAYIDDWVWNGAPLYEPDAPAAPGAGTWVSFFGPDFSLYRFVNTFVPGGTNLNLANYTFDSGTGTITTNSPQTLPGLNTSGGIGPFTASGLQLEFDNVDMEGIYAALPDEAKYPAWASRCQFLQRRRLGTLFRESVNADVDFNGSASTAFSSMLDGTYEVYNGAPSVTSLNDTATSDEGPIGTGDVGPFGEPFANGNTFGISLNTTPSGMGSVDFDGYYRREALVQERAVMDAYVDDIEVFESEDPAAFGFEMPEQGTGTPYPGVIPVGYDESNGTATGFFIGFMGYSNQVFQNFDETYNVPNAKAALVGNLKRTSDDTTICRIAVLISDTF